jgi:hypothetical protein
MLAPSHLLIAACFLLLIQLPLPAKADGGFIPMGPKDPREKAIQREIGGPEQKALIVFTNEVEDLTLQVKYSGAMEKFVWIIPSPAKPVIGPSRPDLFRALSEFTIPPPPPSIKTHHGRRGTFGGATPEPTVNVLERRQVGYYDVSVLETYDADKTVEWLNKNGYLVSERIIGVLDDYIRRGWFFTVARIDLKRVGDVEALVHSGILQPLRITFASHAPVFPLKISSINSGRTEILLYFMTDTPISPLSYTLKFQQLVSSETLNRLTGGFPQISRPMWLTKLSRRLKASQITRDHIFTFRPVLHTPYP